MIPYDKPYIILKGERKRTTQVIWNDNESLLQSPTFASMADNVVVSRITFEVPIILFHLTLMFIECIFLFKCYIWFCDMIRIHSTIHMMKATTPENQQ